MKKPNTPFPTGGYYGKKYFCNRDAETKLLLGNFNSGISTTLVSIRRLGKTALIQHLRHLLPDEQVSIYLDIHATENTNDLLNSLVTAVATAIPENSAFGKKAWKFLQSLRPVISFDYLTGIPQFSFNLQHKDAENNVQGIMHLMEQHPFPVLIAIDEFQQVLNYPEGNMDAWLRSIVQQLRNVSFIFAGSRQHIMTELFNHPSRPFYRSTQLMKLDKIPEEEYMNFIIAKFRQGGKTISEQTSREILEWTERYTYYVQLLCNRIYMVNQKVITKETWQGEAYKLLKEQEAVFFNFRELLTLPQWSLLKAIAKEKVVYKPTGSDFISVYKLGSSAAVLRSLNSLLEKEMVYFDYDEKGNKYYKVYDLLLKKWLAALYY